jgi:hypothetical protein
MMRVIPVLVLLLLAGCGDPLPPDAEWLAGRWQWIGSCCSITGAPDLPSSPDVLVIDLHHNGDAEIYRHGSDTVRTRFDVDIVLGDTLVRFEDPLIYNRSRFMIKRRTPEQLGLIDSPPVCVDCPSSHGFARAP